MHSSLFAQDARRGAAAAGCAYFCWGIVPLYWRLLATADATEIIAHRIRWSLVFLLAIQAARRRLDLLMTALRDRRAVRLHACSGALLTINWLVYIWGVNHGYVIECSLGYFLVPLLNAALARVVLRETLRRGQRWALAFAAVGVSVLAAQVGRVPWIALGLASSFGFYGLLRKQSSIGPMSGLALETLAVVPLALGYLAWAVAQGTSVMTHLDAPLALLLLSTGVVTTIPLLLFAYGAQRLRFTTLGLLQYVAPTCQFLIGWLVFREPFSSAQAWAFSLIWAGLILYSADAWRAATAKPAITV